LGGVSAGSAFGDISGGVTSESSTERRRHARYPLQVNARLALPGGETRSCQVQDFGAGGLFLALDEAIGESIVADGKPLSRDDKVVVQFAGEQGPSGRPEPASLHSISAPIARVLPTGLGLAFVDLDGPSVQAVRQLVVLVRQDRAPVAGAPRVDPAPLQPPRAVAGDAMHTARCLMRLERHMRATDSTPDTVAAVAISEPAASQVDPEARELIIDALVILQRAPEFLAPDPDEPLALEDRLLSTWEAAGLNVTEADGMVVEIVSKLLDAVLDDPLIKAEIKHCIRRLAIPLVKVALQDGFFFFANEQHPARMAINRLGSLEPSLIGSERWAALIEPLVDQIVAGSNKGGSGDGYVLRQSIFSEVLPALDAVFEEQSRHYDEIVANVAREQSKQQSLLEILRKAAAATDSADSDARQEQPPELERWLGRVEQLQAGDVVYRRVQESLIEKLNLATVSDDRGKYLFVDAAGNKAATYTRQELAMQFRCAELWMIDASKLPILERGLFRMLNDLHRRIARRVILDEPTGLLNRKGLEATLEQALNGALSMGSSHALCVLELDLLGEIVQKCGRDVAAELLRNFVRVLENTIRGKGIAGRLRAGRFAVLLHHCTADSGKTVMESLRAVMETSQCKWHSESFRLAISAGLAPVDGHSASVSAVFEAADKAYRQARAAGGNRVHVYESQSSTAQDQAAAVWMISDQLAAGRLQLRCQRVAPVAADTLALPHYELLLGVNNAEGETTLPGAFLQAAERNNQMGEVDRWVVQTALRWMADNSSMVDQVDGYSINISGLTLADENFCEYVRGVLAHSRVSPEKIIFEITESSAIDSSPLTVNFIHAMKAYGCRISLDKFGSGESSLAHLETLPIDFVKIDGSLIRDIAADARDLVVVRSLNEIGHFLGKKTVAECVESPEVLTRLRQIGVDYAQGFAIDEPILLL
jgi:diguanylate cyclase (GGDEF)-like protein